MTEEKRDATTFLPKASTSIDWPFRIVTTAVAIVFGDEEVREFRSCGAVLNHGTAPHDRNTIALLQTRMMAPQEIKLSQSFKDSLVHCFLHQRLLYSFKALSQ
jgi:hypothetical protein